MRRGHGNFLTMEFGNPHLSVREPIITSHSSSNKVERILQRRHIDVVGDWRLWVQYAEWKLTTNHDVLTNKDPAGSPSDECLRALDGQRFLSVESGSTRGSYVFRFDLGGVLEIRPSTEIPDDQCSLYIWEGDIVSCSSTGKLVHRGRDPDGQCSSVCEGGRERRAAALR